MLVIALPVCASMIDLSKPGSTGTINGAIFEQCDPMHSTGTGQFNSFLRIQAKGVEEGFNVAKGIKSPLDTKDSTTLRVSDLPLVIRNKIPYREFYLDINQTAKRNIVSLDDVKIAVSSSGTLSSFDEVFASPIYSFSSGDWIKLNYRLEAGSGKGDMRMLIPDVLFDGKGDYVYLYSQFGANPASDSYSANAGFEEWGFKSNLLIAEPSTVILLSSVLFFVLPVRKK